MVRPQSLYNAWYIKRWDYGPIFNSVCCNLESLQCVAIQCHHELYAMPVAYLSGYSLSNNIIPEKNLRYLFVRIGVILTKNNAYLENLGKMVDLMHQHNTTVTLQSMSSQETNNGLHVMSLFGNGLPHGWKEWGRPIDQYSIIIME